MSSVGTEHRIVQQVRHKNALLVLLTVIMLFNYMDRLTLGLLVQDIKLDLDLSDTQLGLLTGIAFALFYSVMGIPIARWADRGDRVTIVALTTALWSIMVALSAAATSFVHLLMVRVGVAVGEAGCHPPALSLIADYFTRAERPRAVARYMLGWPLALLVGNFAAGWLNELYGWRSTFVILGLPGLVLAVLAAIFLYEPRRKSSAVTIDAGAIDTRAAPTPETDLKQVVSSLWRIATFRHLVFYFSLAFFFSYGLLQWLPAFFARSHHLGTAELGTWLGLIYGAGGILGTWLGGEFAARYAANNERLQFIAVAVLFAVFAALMVGVYLAPDHQLAFGLLAASSLGGAMVNGPMYAATQTLVPPHMRAMSIALVMLCANLVGMGLGPLAVGVLSDVLRPTLGEESLRYALLAFCPGYLWVSWHAWRASQTAARDMGAAHDEEGPIPNAVAEMS